MVTFLKQCVLNPEKICDNCGECENRCQLDPQKICDNCFRCLETDRKPYAEIPIGKVLLDESDSDEPDFAMKPDIESGDYVLDSDDSWREPFSVHVVTLPHAHARRKRRPR